ncbi:MAG: STAS domain-containing protein [Syntrophothermus sp.]
MDFIKEFKDDIEIIHVNITRATLKEAEEFKKLLYVEIEDGRKKIIVDLIQSEFIDSTFLGALVVSLKRIRSMGGDLKLAGLQPAVRSMFELTRMYRVFEIHNFWSEAVESFK